MFKLFLAITIARLPAALAFADQVEIRPGVYKVGGGVSAPSIIHNFPPEYTEEARKARLEGAVVLYAEIDSNGSATNIRVLRGLGLGLDEKAIEAVSHWRFKPGEKDGKPVTVAATVELQFRLLRESIGSFTGALESDRVRTPLRLTLALASKLSGAIVIGPSGKPAPLENLKLNGSDLTFQATGADGPILFHLSLSGPTLLTSTMNGEAESVDHVWRVSLSPAPADAPVNPKKDDR